MAGKRQKKKGRFKWRTIIFFIAFELIFSAAAVPFIIFYGPFENLKKTVVGASIFSFRHQYIAKTFLSDNQINRILYGEEAQTGKDQMKQNFEAIKVNNRDNGIECHQIQGRKFDGYVLVIHNPTRVRVGCSNKLGIQGEKTSQIAQEFDAIAAINGGGFADKSDNSHSVWTGTGAYPEGIVIVDGNVVYPNGGINPDAKIKGCIAGMTYDGLLVIGKYSLNELKEKNIRDAIVFGPPLIINGVIEKGVNNEGVAPRTAIGQRKDGSIVMAVIDGRRAFKMGASIEDIQNIMVEEKAYNAVNLDGGASTTMYFDGNVINTPSDKFGERTIPTIFYVSK